MDQKYEETELKFEETDQQNEILKVFKKSPNQSKIWGPKIWGIQSTKWDFLKFL